MHELVEKFREQFTRYGFSWQNGISLISHNPKLLFNISGGVIFEKIIANGIMPTVSRIASIQPCLRTDSWSKIGISGRHHLVFDMLGHFSMYELSEQEAKKIMIQTAFNYLVNYVGLNSCRLAATIHPQDQISYKIWQECGIYNLFYDENNTDINPDRTKSGLRTEILWQQKETDNPMNRSSYIELWNLVFTQFASSKIFFQPMKKIAVDSGVSLDRLITANEGFINDYDNSRWIGQITKIQNQTESKDKVTIFRLADMIQAIVRLMIQNLKPGNKAASYVLRKIIRESYTLALKLDISLSEICRQSTKFWLGMDSSELITKTLEQEINCFQRCLQQGKRVCQKILHNNNGIINEDDLLFLSSTYGFPRELALIEQERKGMKK